jgi:hypothetical protein
MSRAVKYSIIVGFEVSTTVTAKQRMPSCGMWHREGLVRTDVSEERVASILGKKKSQARKVSGVCWHVGSYKIHTASHPRRRHSLSTVLFDWKLIGGAGKTSCRREMFRVFWIQGTYSIGYWSSGQSFWLQIQRSRFRSRHYQIFWVVRLERGPLSPVNTIEELRVLVRKSSGSGL